MNPGTVIFVVFRRGNVEALCTMPIHALLTATVLPTSVRRDVDVTPTSTRDSRHDRRDMAHAEPMDT